MVSFEVVAEAVNVSLLEDVGPDLDHGDITSQLVVGDEDGSAEIIVNQDGIVAGLLVAETVFKTLDREIKWRPEIEDGAEVHQGQVVVRISGRLTVILKGERTALNFLSHLSGIASLTSSYVEKVSETRAAIFDTRKTTPGLRALEKYAVKVGGGHNHRLGLFDGILIKDNHLVGRDLTRVIKEAGKNPFGYQLEVEVETISQLKEAIEAGADIVLLDNMDMETLREAIGLAKGKVEVEVSGGMDISNVSLVAAAGADRISVGALTQAATPLDFSLTVNHQERAP